MELNEYKVFADRCFRDTLPPCGAVCPFSYDVREIEEAEETGRKVYDPEQDIYYAHQRFGHATVWAGDQIMGDGVLVTSVYCHRVEVEESL